MELTYKKKNIYAVSDEAELKRISEYCEGYKQFLDNGKTEREAVAETVKMAEKAGYKPYTLGDKINKGDKLYYNNRGKSLFLLRAGTANITENGVRILVAHVDSPRLDLKQVPLYEKSDIAFLKTHYYGGIKKYHWLTIPLALHGVVMLKNGKKQIINIGEAENDPVFYITDLLPHLSQEINSKTIAEGFKAENLNIIIGGIPARGEDSDAVKKGVLQILNAKYSIIEEDFLSAELEAVPAAKAKDVGLDRAFIAAYGHDDSVCAYPEITATLQTETAQTVLTILADKEEIGSEGNTGMQCVIIDDILNEIAKSYGVNPAVVREHSMCISADVTAAFDPAFASAFEEMNVGLVNHGVTMNKFTGARGKSGSNDASAEFVGYLRGVFDKENVVWQTGELGRVDLGGGGTVAKYIAKNNIDTVDMGVPVLSMHAPYELISKADIYSAHKAFAAFIK
ncbi:aminopeptidase [Anaerocaecibacter muris]|uniref:aminopeptidase n=1 Tax=Anaerocaecibacter muris TaxID=2941513 RepID=UPI0020423A80|nr:aminopeptidase [Anaerocaecibacter muris]